MTMHISSYPSVYALGHKSIEGIFNSPVLVEEKIDGSQFSMSRIEGQLKCRSKGKDLIIEAPEKMFTRAVETAGDIDLHPGWIYRCEYLERAKHNTLKYSRTPIRNLIVFDIHSGIEEYLSYSEKEVESRRIGLECVPILYYGIVDSLSMFNSLLEKESILGGTRIEGVVVKNYSLFTGEKKVAMGKYVSESFKETNATDWKERNPTQKDVVRRLIDKYHTDARWKKAVQHLREAGRLEGSPRDIGVLIREVPDDILKECESEIRDELFSYFWPHIQRGVTAGFPQWYKDELAKSSFDEPQ